MYVKSSHSYSFKGQSLTSPRTVSSVTVAQMWHRNITIFTHCTIPAQQRVRVWLHFVCLNENTLVFCCEANRENSKNRNKHILLLLLCQLKVHAGKAPEHFVQLVWNKVRGSHVPSCTQRHQGISYMWMHTNKHAAGDNKDVRKDKVVPLTSGSCYICQSHV